MSSNVVRTRKQSLRDNYAEIVVIILTRELTSFWPKITAEEIQAHAHEVMNLVLTKIPVTTPKGKRWRYDQHKDQVQDILDTYINTLKNSKL